MARTWHDYEMVWGGFMIFETVVAAVVAIVLFSIWFSNDDWRE